MTVWGDLSKDEYEAIKRVIAEIDAAEANFQRPLRTHPLEACRDLDAMRLKMRSAVEGYEAANKENN